MSKILKDIVENVPVDNGNIILGENQLIIAQFKDRTLMQVVYYDTQFLNVLNAYMDKISFAAPEYENLYTYEAPKNLKWIVKQIALMMEQKKPVEKLPIDYVKEYSYISQKKVAGLLASAVYTFLGRRARFFPKSDNLIISGPSMTESLGPKITGYSTQFKNVYLYE